MPTYSDRLVIAFPLADLELANRFARLFDPDVGGAQTFTDERQTAGYVWTETVVYDYLEGLVRTHDPAQWYPLLYALAVEKGVEPPTEEDVTHLCSVILIDPNFEEIAPNE